MSLNVYVGATLMLFVAAAGMMTGIFSLKKRKSRLWLVPIFPLSMTVFTAIFMYILLADSMIMISPWIAVLYIFSEIGALLGCYINENLEPKSNLIRAVVIILSVALLIGLVTTFMLTVYENAAV